MSTRRLGVAAALVGGALLPGDVEVEDEVIHSVGVLPAGRGGTAVPGFVDVQVNGFGGVDFTTTDVDGYRAASQAIARTGVTSFLATIPTAPIGRYPVALSTATAATAGSLPGARVVGVHLEGPFLSPDRAGAHHVEWLRAPDPTVVDAMIDAGPVVLMTVAPELVGGLELVAHLRRRGVVVSVGHSDADAAAAHRAFDAGATAITHLWNAHRPIRARDPGVGGVALVRPDVFVCAIGDLTHVAAETLLFSASACGERFVLTTDAVAPAGLDDGTYRIAGQDLSKSGGEVRLQGGSLAGSACGMDQMVRNLVELGVSLPSAVASATVRPAQLLGDRSLGRLFPGGRADVVVLDDALVVMKVLVDGREPG